MPKGERNAVKTRCPQGHVYSDANTYRFANRRGGQCRSCRACDNIRSMRRGALKRGYQWALPDALVEDLVSDNCFYCGATPAPLNGIDRVDNGIGYTETNVVACCKWCNTAKHKRSRADFEAWAIRVAEHTQRSEQADGRL